MKTITKKFILGKVAVTRGSGFNPYYSYYARIDGHSFSRSFIDPNVYVGSGFKIGRAENKKEFVEVIQDFLIEMKKREEPKVIEHYSDKLIVQATQSDVAEITAQEFLDNLEDASEYKYQAGRAEPTEHNIWVVKYTDNK